MRNDLDSEPACQSLAEEPRVQSQAGNVCRYQLRQWVIQSFFETTILGAVLRIEMIVLEASY